MQIILSLLYNINIIIISYYVTTIKIIWKRLSVKLSAQQDIIESSIWRVFIHRQRYTFYFFCTRQTVNLHIRPDPNNNWVSDNSQIVLYYSIMYIIRLWVADVETSTICAFGLPPLAVVKYYVDRRHDLRSVFNERNILS